VKSGMDSAEFRAHCKKFAEEVADVVEGYAKNNFKILGFLGKRGSPSCGVKETWTKISGETKLVKEQGIFVEELQRELERRKIKLKFVDFEREEVESCVEELEGLVK